MSGEERPGAPRSSLERLGAANGAHWSYPKASREASRSAFSSGWWSVLEQPGVPKRAHKRWGTLQRAFGHFRGERPPRWGRQSELVFPFNILNTPVATSFVVHASFSILNRNFQLELPFRPTKTTTDKRQSLFEGAFCLYIFFPFFKSSIQKTL